MNPDIDDPLNTDGLAATEARLRAARPEPTAVELDRALATARRRAACGARPSPAFLRSKVAITAILALGLVTSGAGTTLAFQGSSGSGDASSAQYGAPAPGVSPGEQNGGNQGNEQGETLGNAPRSPQGSAVQAARQETANANGKQLPFTGYAAIPIIVIGLVLLSTGAVLQRRLSRSRT